MRRRRALAALFAVAALGPAAPAFACRGTPRCRIGVFFWRKPTEDVDGSSERDPGTEAFRGALREMGWEEGRNLEITWRTAQGEGERLGAHFEEARSRGLDLVVVTGNRGLQESRARGFSRPVVTTQSTTPVELGLVRSIARPGGNITGMVGFGERALYGKRLSLLKEADPRVRRVAFMTTYDIVPNGWEYAAGVEEEARSLGLSIFPVAVGEARDLDRAFDEALRGGANGAYFDSALAASRKDQALVSACADRRRLPVVYPFLHAAQWGGLLAYDRDDVVVWRRTARFVDRVLRGADPGSLPMEQAARMHLAINARAAEAIGLRLPRSLLRQADRIVD